MFKNVYITISMDGDQFQLKLFYIQESGAQVELDAYNVRF